MTPRTILHVGPHKTGSTAIQLGLHHEDRSNRERLLRAGVVYPRTTRTGGMFAHGHFALLNYLRDDPHGTWRDQFNAEIAECPVVVLSNETFSRSDEDMLARLRDLLPGDRPVEVIYYLRRLVDLWPSHWQERIRQGSTMSLPSYVAYSTMLAGDAELAGHRVDQVAQVERLRRVFGPGSIRVIGYDALIGAGRDVADHFVREIVGLDDGGPAVLGGRPNPSQPAWRTELLRLLNQVHRAADGKASHKLRIALFSVLDGTDPAPGRAGELLEEIVPAFKKLVHERGRTHTLRCEGPVRAMQARTLEALAGALVSNGSEVADAYMAPVERHVTGFDFPWSGEPALAARIVDLHRELERGR